MRIHDRETAGVYATAAILILTAVGLAYGTKMASPHEATPTASMPLGWKYPWSCCSGIDCRDVGDSGSGQKERVYETTEGYRFSTSNEVIPYGDKRIKDSPDGRFHWCTQQGKSNSPTICLFVPPRSF